MSGFECYLCTRAGRESGPQFHRAMAICTDCVELFRLRQKRWCNTGLHMTDCGNWSRSHSECRDCQRDRDRRRDGIVPPPPGYVRLSVVAQQTGIPKPTLREWINRGWMADKRHSVGRDNWIKQMDRYPEPPRGKRGPKGPWRNRKEQTK